MDGYSVGYKTPGGGAALTWMGKPFGNCVDQDDEYYISEVMKYAHPGCTIISIVPCSLERFEFITNSR